LLGARRPVGKQGIGDAIPYSVACARHLQNQSATSYNHQPDTSRASKQRRSHSETGRDQRGGSVACSCGRCFVDVAARDVYSNLDGSTVPDLSY
jgi:hypothetical protein